MLKTCCSARLDFATFVACLPVIVIDFIYFSSLYFLSSVNTFIWYVEIYLEKKLVFFDVTKSDLHFSTHDLVYLLCFLPISIQFEMKVYLMRISAALYVLFRSSKFGKNVSRYASSTNVVMMMMIVPNSVVRRKEGPQGKRRKRRKIEEGRPNRNSDARCGRSPTSPFHGQCQINHQLHLFNG